MTIDQHPIHHEIPKERVRLKDRLYLEKPKLRLNFI